MHSSQTQPSSRFIEAGGLKKVQNKIKKYVKKQKRVPIYENFINIAAAAERGIWSEFSIISWTDLLRSCGFTPRVGKHGILWKKWENWCVEFISLVYDCYQIRPDTILPNKKYPDFNYKLSYQFVICDAKIDAQTRSIEKSIKNYISYCDKLEFWVLYGHREDEIHDGKKVEFYNSYELLDRIKEISSKDKMTEWLNDLYAFKDRSFINSPAQTSLIYYLEKS